MKNFISKVRNKRLKGNISLLVILILLASSVISLLSINQIQHLITYGNMTFNYFRAFYLAKAWNELALTEIYNRENWFENKIVNEEKEDGSIGFDDIIKNNFMWPDNKYEWFKPYFDMEIVSRFNAIVDDVRKNECDGNKITLKGNGIDEDGNEISWEWIVLQLFKDETWESNISNILNFDNTDYIKKLDDDDIKKLKFRENPGANLMFWFFGYDNKWDMTNIIVKKSTSLESFIRDNRNGENGIEKIEGTRKYLSIKNVWTSDVEFCIEWNDKIPYSHYLVTVRGNYADMEVWLQSVVKKDFPSWSLDLVEQEEE